ncbi:MAG: TPM domain-containing protein, partial [Bacteroidales bacterium]
MRSFLIICLLTITQLISAQTYTVETVPNVQLKNAHAFVSNPDGILSAATVATLDSMLYHLRQTNTSEFVVVALNSIGDADARNFATALFQKWGIGRKEKDNGLLLLFVKDQRQALTEVGYGLEGILPDAINKRLMMKYMFPYFKTGDYNQGMIDGVRAFITYMTTDEANQELMVAAPAKENGIDWGTVLFWYIIVSLAVGFFFLGSILSAQKNAYDSQDYSKYRAIISYKDFSLILCFIFPLTMIPLYLWLVSKLHLLRNKPHTCDHCGGKMHKLS